MYINMPLTKPFRLYIPLIIPLHIEHTILRTTWSSVSITSVWSKTAYAVKLGGYEVIKDERSSFLNIDTYLRGQFSMKICVSTARNKLSILNITDQLTRGAHDFIGKQNDIAENLRELQNQPI